MSDAVKHDAGKARWDLVPVDAFRGVSLYGFVEHNHRHDAAALFTLSRLLLMDWWASDGIVNVLASSLQHNLYLLQLELLGDRPGRDDEYNAAMFPMAAMEEVAHVLTYGATKYTIMGECTCQAKDFLNVSTVAVRRHAQYAETNTNKDCVIPTLSFMQDKKQTDACGQSKTKKSSKPTTKEGTQRDDQTQNIKNSKNSEEFADTTNFSQQNGNYSPQTGAQYAGPAEDFASTTATQRVRCEERCATHATSGSASLSAQAGGSKEHSSTCESRKIIHKGERNWEKGTNWSRFYSAALRHDTAWQSGAKTDNETGLSHLAHAACNRMFLLTYQLRGVGVDDRPVR